MHLFDLRRVYNNQSSIKKLGQCFLWQRKLWPSFVLTLSQFVQSFIKAWLVLLLIGWFTSKFDGKYLNRMQCYSVKVLLTLILSKFLKKLCHRKLFHRKLWWSQLLFISQNFFKIDCIYVKKCFVKEILWISEIKRMSSLKEVNIYKMVIKPFNTEWIMLSIV